MWVIIAIDENNDVITYGPFSTQKAAFDYAFLAGQKRPAKYILSEMMGPV